MKEKISGRVRAVRGSMKEALGKLTGSDELEAQGAREKEEGRLQHAAERAAQEAEDASS